MTKFFMQLVRLLDKFVYKMDCNIMSVIGYINDVVIKLP